MKSAKMTAGEINALRQNMDNLALQLGVAAGDAVIVEMQMRLICQLSELVRHKLVNADYLNCDLGDIVKAIEQIFKEKLAAEPDPKILLEFIKLRNNLVHIDFVGFMKVLKKPLMSRDINNKKPLEACNIQEAIVGIEKCQGLREFSVIAKQVQCIMEKILFSLAHN